MYLMVDLRPFWHTTYLSVWDLYCYCFSGCSKWVSFKYLQTYHRKILSGFSLKAVICALIGVVCLVSPMV